MIAAIIGLLEAGLKIWELKERRKYIDQLVSLKQAYYEEYNKPLSDRSDAVLDNLEFQLRLITLAVTADLREQNLKNQHPSAGV